jgi:beta-galactosidase
VSRFGTEVQSGNRNGYSDPLSYEAQSRFYIQRFDMLKSLAYDGALISSLSDWKGDRPALTVNTGDPWMHTMGLVSYQREKRLAYEAVRSIFRSEKFVALPIGNFMPSAPIIYVLAGLVVLIGVAYLYNASRRFREALNRSLLNSFNFFADVRDQRVVSVIHSTLLGIIVSVATAIVISSVLYHFRGSWVLDNMLSYVLVYDNIKEAAVRLIWHPLQSILYLSMVFFVGLLLIAAGMLAVSPLFKSRIYPFHAYAITMWSTPPLIALVPLGMILFRLMETTVYVIPSLVIVAGLLAWVVLRLFKGISIIFDTMPARVYFVGVVGLVAVAALGYLYYDYTQSTSAYLSFMYNTAAGSR